MSLPAWSLKPFSELSAREFHDIVQLRVDVFVVEQSCIYPELDGADVLSSTLHLQGLVAGELVAYARLLDTENTDPQGPIRIGRVLTRADHRGTGLGREMMQHLLIELDRRYPLRPVKLSAQVVVVDFYRSLGFTTFGPDYVEDGIQHIDMELGK
ncbi:MAG: GNAT family N-acetyltransferase [Gammaproteobacteria bacterium]|nr:GNAT family N-acetyltransferase [Gammaproteobacteria bacterium]